MWLTKNEKKVLKLLIENSKLSDTSIANRLGISSQAIGRIRKKLEEEIIKKYTLELDFQKLGINLFTICKANLTQKGLEVGKKEVEKKFSEHKNIVSCFKLIGDMDSFLIILGLKNIDELDQFFHDREMKEFHELVRFTDLKPVNSKNILKHNFNSLYEKTIDEIGIKNKKNEDLINL